MRGRGTASRRGTITNAILEGIAPYRQSDGAYRFENTWRFAIGRKH